LALIWQNYSSVNALFCGRQQDRNIKHLRSIILLHYNINILYQISSLLFEFKGFEIKDSSASLLIFVSRCAFGWVNFNVLSRL
jgi:hypothetical protein